MKREASLYEKIEGGALHCQLCAHGCKIANQKFGICGVRQNIDGALYTHVFASPCALHVDPIEKKPLYHFLPGSLAFSIATIGCNFRCDFCQNWEISQGPTKQGGQSISDIVYNVYSEEVQPKEVVAAALKNNCRSISYTYTEPTIFFEYAYETAKLAKAKGLCNSFVTNGYMSKEALTMIRPYLDAANVDLKFFKDSSYRKICGATLQPILDSIRLMKELGIWVEVTTLVVTGENDSEEELGGIAKFLAGVDKNIPWHISRFHPDYKFGDHNATPQDTLRKAEELGRGAGLNYIYVGNVAGWGNDTNCHSCDKLVLKREVFSILEYHIKEGKCAHCGEVIPGVF